jgi:hypothetical protein
MNSLQHTGASFQDGHRSSFNLDISRFTARDIELGSSSNLNVPKIRRFASPALSELSIHGRTIYTDFDPNGLELSPPDNNHLHSIKERLRSFWQRNWGLAFVLFAQFFGTLMTVTARLLEQGGPNRKGMHPFQVKPTPIVHNVSICLILIYRSSSIE